MFFYLLEEAFWIVEKIYTDDCGKNDKNKNKNCICRGSSLLDFIFYILMGVLKNQQRDVMASLTVKFGDSNIAYQLVTIVITCLT